MKHILFLICLSFANSSIAFDTKKISKILVGSYSDVSSKNFKCPEGMTNFYSKPIKDSFFKFYNVGCRDSKGEDYGLLFIGDKIDGIQHSSLKPPKLCNSKKEFEKYFAGSGWDVRYNEKYAFENKYLTFGGEYLFDNKHMLMTGLCSKNKFLTIFRLKPKSYISVLDRIGWIK